MADRVLAFFGNRYSPLSLEFFHGLLNSGLVGSGAIRLILIDTSTMAQASLRTRLRNRGVSSVKKVLKANSETVALDWFKSDAASGYSKHTPSMHDINSESVLGFLSDWRANAALVAGCDQILKPPILENVHRIVNFHNSLLPDYRGVNAIQWAFLEGQRVAGYTFHTIEDSQIDQGRIVFQKPIAIEPNEHLSVYSSRIIRDAAANLEIVLAALFHDRWPPDGPHIVGGEYFSRKRMQQHRVFDPSLPADEALHRFSIIGSLDIELAGVRHKITSLESFDGGSKELAVGGWTAYQGGIMVQCLEGRILIKSISYLPARLFLFLFPRRLGTSKV